MLARLNTSHEWQGCADLRDLTAARAAGLHWPSGARYADNFSLITRKTASSMWPSPGSTCAATALERLRSKTATAALKAIRDMQVMSGRLVIT